MFGGILYAILAMLAVLASSQEHSYGPFPHFPGSMKDDSLSSPPAEYAKRRPAALRNCFLSPVQCLLPVDNRRFNKFHKRFIF
ncbi:hypothetical protein Q1695_000549 [Nippostrongylus brasiliensis]|nr:hypothetical protein Q1695_000549 [Nippostrongylus brasiliensis]